MWAGLEPERGVYNRTYMETVRKIVRMAEARGIYVLLDMHQDVLNEKFCGEGFPDWAVGRQGEELLWQVPYADPRAVHRP